MKLVKLDGTEVNWMFGVPLCEAKVRPSFWGSQDL
jgi:hypothetical protein